MEELKYLVAFFKSERRRETRDRQMDWWNGYSNEDRVQFLMEKRPEYESEVDLLVDLRFNLHLWSRAVSGDWENGIE